MFICKPIKQLWIKIPFINTRAVWKVRGLTLLLRVGALWSHSDGLFFKVPPLASDALHTMLHPLLKNVLQTVDYFKISCLGAPFSWLEKPRNRIGWNLDCMAGILVWIHWSTFSKLNTIQFRSRPILKYHMKILLGDFDAKVGRENILHLSGTRKEWECIGTVHQFIIDFEKAYDSVRREVLHNILTEFGTSVKVVRKYV
jgi:hypothetical protein